jgi:uncharacterized protein YndB with AHSA1/START domain
VSSPRRAIWCQGVDRSAAPADVVRTGRLQGRTREIDICVGGRWRFVFVAPDGARYDNRMVFLKIEPPRLLEMIHGADRDDDPNRFRTIITFDEQSNGKTVVTLRQLHPTKARRNSMIGFGAVEYGYQTLDKLAKHVETLKC